jgi:6-pyruvoyltetrahydropterin/6-carboxytetrahydropterin synthase
MPTWKLHTKYKFDAAHLIEDYKGKCGRMHGHTYKVHVTATSSELHQSENLDRKDMVCDFSELKWPAKDVKKGGLDHTVLNETLSINPTAERIAEFIYKETKQRIPEGVKLKVTLWETDNCWVEYSEDDV